MVVCFSEFPAVVFRVCADFLDQDPALAKNDGHQQPEAVAADVEDNPVAGKEARRGEIPFHIRGGFPFDPFHEGPPGGEWARRLGVFPGKGFQDVPAEDLHLRQITKDLADRKPLVPE
jgi:hypothetical protein